MGIKEISNKLLQAEEKVFVDSTMAENNVKEGIVPALKKRAHAEPTLITVTMCEAGIEDGLLARTARIKRAAKKSASVVNFDTVTFAIKRASSVNSL